MKSDFDTKLIAALPRLRRYALSLCHTADVADDLVQTSVERAIKNRARHDPATDLLPWMMRILRNAWIDQTRRTATRGTELDVGDIPHAAVFDGDRALEARLALRETEAALATLPPEQQEVVRLVCLEELSYTDAAVVLGVPKGTVMSRLARGRMALAQKLGIS